MAVEPELGEARSRIEQLSKVSMLGSVRAQERASKESTGS
jgi:hypothetical protein